MSIPRRPGVPPAKPSSSPADDVRALELMGQLLDLGVTPSRAAETMTMLAVGRTEFVTQLKKADEEWTADRAAAAADEEDRLPDFLDDDHPASKQPPANQPHSLNLRRPGVRR